MNTEKFLWDLQDMYGPFPTEGMMRAVAGRISPLTDSQRGRLFEVYCRTVPGNYRPDLKNVLHCMELGNIKPLDKSKRCASCGYRWTSTQVECPVCSYMPDEGDPVQYHYEFVNECGRFDMQAIKESLARCPFVRGMA